MNGLALCAGVGGLELGLKLALGERYKTVCYVEREAYCTSVLVARMADKALDRAPIWDDLTTFAGKCWRRPLAYRFRGLVAVRPVIRPQPVRRRPR